MKIYFAGSISRKIIEPFAVDIYRLQSFVDFKGRRSENIVFKDFILDSGAFTFMRNCRLNDIDWNKYIDEYAIFIKKHNIQNYIELDIDSIIGVPETERLRYFLEKKVGRRCIPVWHVQRGYDKWIELCKNYEYICIGGFVTKEIKESHYPIITKLINDANKNNCRVHGLGFTNFKWLPRLHFYSVDSSSFLSGSRYGHVSMFNGESITNIDFPIGKMLKNSQALRSHNLQEWVKFSRYAEIKL